MDPESARAVRVALLREQARATDQVMTLTHDLNDIVSSAEHTATDDEHDPEGHTLAFERQQVAALLIGAQARLTEADAALIRFDSSEYGTCEHCRMPIGRERLEARPTTRTCISCARGAS